MVRNCCLSLCQFEIPQEILFDYGRVAQLLVRVLQTHSSDSLTQRIVVFLLNSMVCLAAVRLIKLLQIKACHVEGDQKIQVGDIGAIEVSPCIVDAHGKRRMLQIILEQINRKYASSTCDEVMEVGWSFLWNITGKQALSSSKTECLFQTKLPSTAKGFSTPVACSCFKYATRLFPTRRSWCGT